MAFFLVNICCFFVVLPLKKNKDLKTMSMSQRYDEMCVLSLTSHIDI
jgi:hypothetical protein